MKLTCPGCSAKYTLSDERLDGRRAKVRCKRCGESFPVDPARSGEVYAHHHEGRRARDADLFAGLATAGAEDSVVTSASREVDVPTETGAIASAAPLTGERNESSVLFSLAALAKQGAAPRVPEVTGASRANEVANLSGGGAFAPLFALSPPLVPPMTFEPIERDGARRFRKGPLAIGGMALATVAMVGIGAVAAARSTSSDRDGTRRSIPDPAVTSSEQVPSVAAPSKTLATAPNEPRPASSAPLDVTPARTGTTSNVAPPARSSGRSNDPRIVANAPTVSTVSTQAPSAKCCPNESEIACQMRISAGTTCGADAPASTLRPAPPFDRPAAARALAINLSGCRRADSTTGAGHVTVTIQPGGAVSAVNVDAPYAGTATGTCIAQRYRSASVPAFSGGPISVGKTFVIE